MSYRNARASRYHLRSATATLCASAFVLSNALASRECAAETADFLRLRDAVRTLAELTTIPSASADHAAVRDAASWLQARFGALGFTTQLLEDSLAGKDANPV